MSNQRIIPPALEGRQAMAHTLVNLLTHPIFSTQDREAGITPDLKMELLPVRVPSFVSSTVR
jgi:hypothetical protein